MKNYFYKEEIRECNIKECFNEEGIYGFTKNKKYTITNVLQNDSECLYEVTDDFNTKRWMSSSFFILNIRENHRKLKEEGKTEKHVIDVFSVFKLSGIKFAPAGDSECKLHNCLLKYSDYLNACEKQSPFEPTEKTK